MRSCDLPEVMELVISVGGSISQQVALSGAYHYTLLPSTVAKTGLHNPLRDDGQVRRDTHPHRGVVSEKETRGSHGSLHGRGGTWAVFCR